MHQRHWISAGMYVNHVNIANTGYNIVQVDHTDFSHSRAHFRQDWCDITPIPTYNIHVCSALQLSENLLKR